jgi:hypothetical protein
VVTVTVVTLVIVEITTMVVETIRPILQVLTLTDGVLMMRMEHKELETPMLMVVKRGELGLILKAITLIM